jgi:hypothetical protein
MADPVLLYLLVYEKVITERTEPLYSTRDKAEAFLYSRTVFPGTTVIEVTISTPPA